jgi:cell wall-associated NlpC family hydrolase
MKAPMTISEEQLNTLVESAEARERNARKRAALYSLIPIVLAGLLLSFSAWQIYQSNQELESINNALQASKIELEAVNQQLDQSQQQTTHYQQEAETAKAQLVETQLEVERVNSQLLNTQKELEDTNNQLENKQKELESTTVQLEKAQAEIEELQKQLDEIEISLAQVKEQLQLATDFRRFMFTGDIFLTLKQPMHPQTFNILSSILDMQDRVGWKWGGTSPEEGFDSPSFAAYLLGENNLLPRPTSEARYSLPNVLMPTNRPSIGDLVFYERGYTMFYLVDENGNPFVIGMTPLGIHALELDFAPILGYGAVNYSE